MMYGGSPYYDKKFKESIILESKTNYTLVGLTVLLLTAGLLAAGLWLSIGFDKKKYNNYIVYMHESVSGLSDESVVKFNGVKVGFVENIHLSQLNPQEVKIILKIEEGTPITIYTEATLITQGITGTTYLGLSATSPSTVLLRKKPGETYPVIPYKPSFFNQLEKNINDVSTGIKRVFDKENAAHIKKTLANLKTISDVIAKNSDDINKTLKDLPIVMDELKVGVSRFNSMAKDVSTAGKQVTTTMKAGRNTIDKISQQAVPPAIVLLHRLDLIAANLEKMSNEMRQNPAVIIRGSASPKVGPGEK
jgi:phospholipid/cholesterol/gamma-HCH transport system substrate-binding protein